MLSFFWILQLSTASSAEMDHPDRVTSIPGAPIEPVFPLYSGYLKVDEDDTEYKMFYVLCEAIRVDPMDAPLMVWLNGGPGHSSLLGFLLGNGPFLLDANSDRLRYNDFSWNQYANVLYIESPSGVGFSHSNSSKLWSSTSYEDMSTGRLNLKALHDFMTRVHPCYATRDFYITGESYGGVYVPYLAREILQHTKTGEFTNANLKGIAMGNAAVDDFSNKIAQALQLYSMGMIPEKHAKQLFDLWQRILSGTTTDTKEIDDFFHPIFNSLGKKPIYDLTLECNRKEDDTQWHIRKPVRSVECDWMHYTEDYMNRVDVQQAMNVRTKDRPTVPWVAESNIVRRRYREDQDTVPVYRDIVANAQDGFRILFYTGDLDLICPPLQVAFAARRIAEENNMTDVSTSPNWLYLGDFGGAHTSYQTEDGRISMDVLTVRGSSHSVPAKHPDRMFQLINNFISAAPKTLIDYSKMIPRK